MISIAIGCILSLIWTLEKMKGLSYVERNIENSDDITKFSRTIEGKYFIEFRAYGGYEYEARQYRRNFPYRFAIEDMISKYTGDNIFPFMLAFMIDTVVLLISTLLNTVVVLTWITILFVLDID